MVGRSLTLTARLILQRDAAAPEARTPRCHGHRDVLFTDASGGMFRASRSTPVPLNSVPRNTKVPCRSDERQGIGGLNRPSPLKGTAVQAWLHLRDRLGRSKQRCRRLRPSNRNFVQGAVAAGGGLRDSTFQCLISARSRHRWRGLRPGQNDGGNNVLGPYRE